LLAGLIAFTEFAIASLLIDCSIGLLTEILMKSALFYFLSATNEDALISPANPTIYVDLFTRLA